MRNHTLAAFFAASLGFSGSLLLAQEFPGNPSFKVTETSAVQKLATLAGCWVGTNPWTMPTKVTYDLAADGTVLVEHLMQEGQTSMYSTIYIDGDTPMLHHFCSYGSQIRMRYTPNDDPNVVHFEFFDATNIKDRVKDDYMTDVKFTFVGEDQLDLEWGLHQNRRDLRERFSFRRAGEDCGYASTGKPAIQRDRQGDEGDDKR